MTSGLPYGGGFFRPRAGETNKACLGRAGGCFPKSFPSGFPPVSLCFPQYANWHDPPCTQSLSIEFLIFFCFFP